MTKGRPPKYSSHKNIKQTGIKNNNRQGDCLKCGKVGIKSCHWHRHIHDDWDERQAEKKNDKFMSKVTLMCNSLIKESCSELLEKYYPEGIQKEKGKEYF